MIPRTFKTLKIFVVICLLCLAISPVAGQTVLEEVIDDTFVQSSNYAVTASGSSTSPRPNAIGIYAAENYVDTDFSIVYFGQIYTNNATLNANQTTVDLKVSGNIVGNGLLTYYRYSTGYGYIVLTGKITTPLSGNQQVGLYAPGNVLADTALDGLKLNPGLATMKPYNTLSAEKPMGFFITSGAGTGRGFAGDYTLNLVTPFKHKVTVSNSTSLLYDVSVYRIVDGKPYNSNTVISGASGEYVNSTGTTDLYTGVARFDFPISVTITNAFGEKYEYEYGVPDNTAPLTISVRSAETGALIPGAVVSILDGDTSSFTNQTLTTGSGTVSLEKSLSLRYIASATADNYTLLSPILFGVGDDGATIVLWMAPDAPPDEPIEEGKSMLYGYVQTQGSQQPISGATVALDGYGSTTTSSTGFYLFNNVTPGTYDISASAPLHDALSEPVTVDSAPTQHNLALKGHYLLTVTIKDADTLANVQNATISLSDGQESTTNPATFTGDYGPYTITAAAGGYYPQTQSAYLDKPGTTTATVLLTAKPEPVPPPEMPNYPPHNVKFTIQTLLGTPLSGVNITAQGIQQTPSTNILEALLGLNMTSTPINSELMSGTTDTNGEINFMMIEAVKYRISLYKPDVVNQTLEIYPKEDTYPIIISTAGGPLLPDAGDALRDIHINVTTSTEGDTGHIHIDYNDTTRKTTGLSIQVTQQNTTDSSAPEEVIASHTVANDANVTHTFDLSVYKGQSFFVRLEAQHPDFGTIHRDYAVAFKGVRVPLGPLPDGLYIYVAGFGLMLLGGIFGATSATRGVVVIAFAGWLFWGFGWLDDLGLIAPVSLGLVSTIAVMGVIVTRYKEEGYT
jgi:hypothetical protein